MTKTKTQKQAKVATAPRGLALSARITWVGKGPDKANPARPGGARFERIELLRKCNGRTVGHYLNSGGNPDTLLFNAHLRWVKVK